MTDGLPVGTTVSNVASFDTVTGIIRTPGGPLGGERDQAQGTLRLIMRGTGAAAAFLKIKDIPAEVTIDNGPRVLGAPIQSFPTDMFGLQGQINGDPDFDLLRVTAGTGFGMPSPGHTTLTQLPGGSWAVDSFFDITYRIDFVGKPGGPFSGMSGSTTGTIRWTQVSGPRPRSLCQPAGNGSGTTDLPAPCPYQGWPVSVVGGLPPGTTLESDGFFDVFTDIIRTPGGTLGGERDQFKGTLTLEMSGTGTLAGYHRTIPIPNVQTTMDERSEDAGHSCSVIRHGCVLFVRATSAG